MTAENIDPAVLYDLICHLNTDTLQRLTPHISALSDTIDEDDLDHWLCNLDDDANADAIAAIVSPGVLAVEADDEDDSQGAILYRTRTYHLTLDGDDTGVKWNRSSAGYISAGDGNSMPGDYVCDLAEGSESAPQWVRDLLGDAVDDIPSITADEITDADAAYMEEEVGPEPDEDPDGEWAVIDMDGGEVGRYATAEEAHAAISYELHAFANSSNSIGGAYLPRSVCHLPCGVVRAGQWSTSYYSPGCDHGSTGDTD